MGFLRNLAEEILQHLMNHEGVLLAFDDEKAYRETLDSLEELISGSPEEEFKKSKSPLPDNVVPFKRPPKLL